MWPEFQGHSEESLEGSLLPILSVRNARKHLQSVTKPELEEKSEILPLSPFTLKKKMKNPGPREILKIKVTQLMSKTRRTLYVSTILISIGCQLISPQVLIDNYRVS